MFRWLKSFLQSPDGLLWAAGVVTLVNRRLDAWGHTVASPFQYVGPNPYATGGDAVTAQQFKLGVIEYVEIALGLKADTTAAVAFMYNQTTGKMQAFWQTPTAGANAPLAEVDNGTDLSGYTAQGIAFGKG